MIKILFCVLSFTVTFGAKDCNTIAASSEKCLKETLFMGDTAVPHTIKDWISYGKVYWKSVKCVKKLQRCFTGIEKQVTVMAVNSVTNFGRYLFGKNANITKHLYAIQCFDNKLVTDLQQCLISHSTRLQFIDEEPSNDLIAQICCSTRLVEQCTFTLIDDNCRVAKKEALQFIRKIMHFLGGENADLMCQRQSTLKICEEQFADVTIDLKEVDTEKYKSDEFILRPSIRILKKLTL